MLDPIWYYLLVGAIVVILLTRYGIIGRGKRVLGVYEPYEREVYIDIPSVGTWLRVEWIDDASGLVKVEEFDEPIPMCKIGLTCFPYDLKEAVAGEVTHLCMIWNPITNKIDLDYFKRIAPDIEHQPELVKKIEELISKSKYDDAIVEIAKVVAVSSMLTHSRAETMRTLPYRSI